MASKEADERSLWDSLFSGEVNTMENMLLQQFRDVVNEFLTEQALIPEIKLKDLIKKGLAAPTEFDAKTNRGFLQGCIKLRGRSKNIQDALNPKAFQVGFAKLDSLYSYNLSGEVTFAARISWSRREAEGAHWLWAGILRSLKRPNTPRTPVR